MKMHKAVVMSTLWGALFLGVSSGAVLVARTIGTYSGACEKLGGFPGLLQSAGFVPKGKCAFIDGKCPTSETCTVDGKNGHCANEVADGKNVCVCVPLRVSR